MFCRKCGQQIPEQAVFCQNCGTKVDTEPQPSSNAGYNDGGEPRPNNMNAGTPGVNSVPNIQQPYNVPGAQQQYSAPVAQQPYSAPYTPQPNYPPSLSKMDYFKQNPSAAYKKRTTISNILYIVSIVCAAILLILSFVAGIKILSIFSSVVGHGVGDVRLTIILRLILSFLLFVGALLLGYFGKKKLKTGMLFGFLICLFFEVCVTVPLAINIPAVNIPVLIAVLAMAIVIIVMTAKSNKEYKQYCLTEMQKH